MKDMMLTEHGDLALMQKSTTAQCFKLNFYIDEHTPIMLTFDFFNRKQNISTAPFSLTFDFECEQNRVSEYIINGKQAIEQQIKMALNTALTERKYDKDYGSQLEKQLYKNFRSNAYLTATAQLAKEAIDKLELFSDYSVQAKFNNAKSIADHSFVITFIIKTKTDTLNIDWELI